MDPNANLKEILELAGKISIDADSDSELEVRLAELVMALDEWICKGGFLPSRWNK